MPKMRMRLPASPTIHTKRYSAFRGVDFSTDPSQVDDSRSPRAVNIIADEAGCPEKRLGWRKLIQVDKPVHGIHRFETVIKSEKDENGNTTSAEIKEYIIHAGSKLYRWKGGEDAPVEILSGLSGDASAGFMHGDNLYILTGEEYVYVKAKIEKGETIPNVTAGNVSDGDKDVVYLPVTRYEMRAESSATTVGEPGLDGKAYEVANTVTPFRRNKIAIEYKSGYGEQGCIIIRLDENIAKGADIGSVTIETEKGNILKGGVKISGYTDACLLYGEKIGANTAWSTFEKSTGAPYLYIDLPSFRKWLVDKKEISDNSTGTKTLNVTITYPAATPVVELPNKDKKEYPDYFDRIRKCRTFGWFNSRLFVAGNPDYPNADWYSEVGDPTYFKEINYTEMGNDDSAILGYLPAGDQQVVIKSDSIQLQDSSVGLRRAEFEEETGYYFPVKRGITGTGALGFGCFATLFDDTMYISKSGVMAVITENITGERVLHGRSSLINNRLLKEPNLDKAITCVWNGYLLIAVNGNVYVADSRQKSYVRNSTGTFEYEWYFWNNVPATCFKENNGALYFGTADGKICKFNTDLYDGGEVSLETYSDWPDGIKGTPDAIVSEWATKFDDDGDFMVKKNLVRRGCGVFLKGARKGNIKVLIRTDKTFEDEIMSANRKRGIFTWDDIDFDNFTFETMPRLVGAFNVRVPDGAVKIKKYSAIQIIVRSDEPNNDFGVLGIERRFIPGYYEK